MADWAQLLILTGLVSSTALNIWLFLRSQPHRVDTRATEALHIARNAQSTVEVIQLRVNAWKVELDNINEAVADGLQRAESKRNRAETAERAAEKRQQLATGFEEQQQPQTREQIIGPLRAALARGQIQ